MINSGKSSPSSHSEASSVRGSPASAPLSITAASVDKEIEILLQRLGADGTDKRRDGNSGGGIEEGDADAAGNDSDSIESHSDSEGRPAIPRSKVLGKLVPPLESYAIPQSLSASMTSLSVHDGDAQAQRDLLESHMIALIAECQAHFLGVKRRLLEERNEMITTRDAFYNDNIAKQQRIIEDLCQDLSRTSSAMDTEVTRLNKIIERILSMYGRRLVSHIGDYSTLKIFMNWKNYTTERKRLNQMCKLADGFNRKILLQRSFHGLMKEHFASRIENNEKEAKYRFDETARQLVERYEGEIVRLQQEANDAYAALRVEQYRRQQLEEDLRRMFLKNMTVMNMEALSLFQQPAPETPMFSSASMQASMVDDSADNGSHHEGPSLARLDELREQMRAQQQALQQSKGAGASPTEAGASKAGSSRSSTMDPEDLHPRLQVPVRITKATYPSHASTGSSTIRPRK